MTVKSMSENREGNDECCGDELLIKLELIGSEGWFLWKMFFLCTIPSILNGIHLTSYVYLAEVPQHWCRIPELSNSNWTDAELLNISSPHGSNQSSCKYYNWDYKNMVKMNFSEALEYIQNHKKPELVACEQYDYVKGISSMVINYDLVCERTALKSMIQVSLSIGKFAGALVFGILSDKYGRRLSFLLGCFLYIISGPLVAFAVNYSMIIAGRVGLGAASSGIYSSAFVILSEITSKKRRAVLGILYNMSYPIGQMIVSLIALFCRNWRMLQVTISVPSVVILGFYCSVIAHIIALMHDPGMALLALEISRTSVFGCFNRFLPESPRWLILNRRNDEAAKIIDRVYTKRYRCEGIELKKDESEAKSMRGDKISAQDKYLEETSSLSKEDKLFALHSKNMDEDHMWKKFCSNLSQVIELLRYFELRSRLLIIKASWCICSLSYYALALNVDNFLTNRYLYGFLTGLAEVASYILPLPLLKYLGRRHTSILLFYLGGLALLTILAIPRHQDFLLLTVASVGRLCASAVFAVVILHTTELFPTLLRNTAIGCCSTAAHIGSMSAPFIVDLLGAYAWFIPSTVCGVVTLLVGTMIFLLPETRNKPLPDTIDDIVNAPKNDKMGFHQICR